MSFESIFAREPPASSEHYLSIAALKGFLQIIFAGLRRDFLAINFDDFVKQLKAIVFVDSPLLMYNNYGCSDL